MAKSFNGLQGIKGFAFDLISIISSGATETIEKVENEISKENITNYIFGRYADRVSMPYDENSMYDLEAWNKALADFSGWVEGNESRKFGITGDNDGLLLLVALIVELLNEPLDKL